jgi:CHAT domain-containing protein
MATDLEDLDALAETAGRGSPLDIMTLAIDLWSRADALEITHGDPATIRLQRIYGTCLLAILGARVNSALLLALSQLMKGKRYAAVAASGAARMHRAGEEEQKLLAAVHDTIDAVYRNRFGQTFTSMADPLAEELLVTPVTFDAVEVDMMKIRDVKDPSLAALYQHEYTVMQAAKLAQEAAAHAVFLDPPAVHAALDEETVLVDLCLIERDGPSALVASLWTRDSVRVAIRPLAAEWLLDRMRADGMRVRVSAVGRAVREARKAFDPRGAQEAPAAEEVKSATIESVSDLLVGLLGEHLAQFKAAGKRHLCIVPHGPFQVAPVHLLRIDGRPIADDWTVTVLPSLAFLLDGAQQPARSNAVAALGLDYRSAATNPFGLHALDDATREAAAIARVFETDPIIDERATERAFLDALEQCRFVHLAAHGRQNAVGPAFHVVYLAPEDRQDGLLFAHELLGRDLRGLEVVTLGACETALGRFDLAGNPWGFPATLLSLGASSVVGTLWDVRSPVALTFFTTFYGRLGQGLRRRDAFAAAQRQTRTEHPAPGDWGAFVFMGR